MPYGKGGFGHRGHRASDHDFSMVPRADIPRSKFRRDFTHKTTFNGGLLVPIFLDEVLPGDTFKVKAHVFSRLATPIVPVMDNLYLDIFFFYCPNRLIWTHWVNMNGEQLNPADSTSYTVPQVNFAFGATTGITAGDLGDHFGLPYGTITNANGNWSCSALPFRAYNLIWNTWFRDENLQNSAWQQSDDGPDLYTNYGLLSRGKRHDYFTSCLPWPQKGTAVNLPLAGQAPIKVSTTNTVPNAATHGSQWIRADTGAVVGNGLVFGSSSDGTGTMGFGTTTIAGFVTGLAPYNLYADLSSITAVTINTMRQSFQIQKLMERDARGGTRYIELLKAHFGVTSPDFRLQRPEFLGGGSAPIVIHPVVQSTQTGLTGGTTPKGDLAAFGTGMHSTAGFHKSFVEHGWILGLAHVRADLSYWQGLPRMWSRKARFDFYWPAFAHLGEQAVLNQEIFLDGSATGTNNQLTFGYQERWAEYRYYPSMITGLFRSSEPTPLDIWHLAINFASLPVLGSSFITDSPPIARISAVPSQPHLLFDSFFEMECTRPMPMYSVPGLIDHF